MATRGTFARIRLAFLTIVLVFVALGSWVSARRSTDWQHTLYVSIYPINGDDSIRTQQYIDSLRDENFALIEQTMQLELANYLEDDAEPMRVSLGPTIDAQLPVPPKSANPLGVIWWSLKMRYTSWRLTRGFDESAPDVRVFVRYFDPSLRTSLDESLGLRKGLIGVANVYARVDQRGANQVIILHEILHTLGATDKYVPGSGQPMYPEGFPEPDRQPLYPQRYAEIMAGRVAVTEHTANIPRSLKLVRFGSKTIAEIGLGNEP